MPRPFCRPQPARSLGKPFREANEREEARHLREHSPDYGTYHGKPRAVDGARALPEFVPASELPRPPSPTRPPNARRPTITADANHDEAESSPNPEAGRGWAFPQLVINPGSFESVRAGFASYAREGETERGLRARVHSTVLADVEQQVMALQALHARLRNAEGGPSFGKVVALSPPAASRSRNVTSS